MNSRYAKKAAAYHKKRFERYAGIDPPKPAKKPKRRAAPTLGGIPSAWLRSASATTRDFL